jgi:hypothetical protein
VTLVRADVSEERIASIIRVFLRSVLRLPVTANVVPSSRILFMLMKEAVLKRAARRHIPEDGIFKLRLFHAEA